MQANRLSLSDIGRPKSGIGQSSLRSRGRFPILQPIRSTGDRIWTCLFIPSILRKPIRHGIKFLVVEHARFFDIAKLRRCRGDGIGNSSPESVDKLVDGGWKSKAAPRPARTCLFFGHLHSANRSKGFSASLHESREPTALRSDLVNVPSHVNPLRPPGPNPAPIFS